MSFIPALEARVGKPLADTAVVQAESMIAYAQSLVAAETGCTWGSLDDIPEPVAAVIVEVVFRAAANPMGVTQDTAGPFSVSFGPQAAQRMYLGAADKTILHAHRCRSPLQTIPTTRGRIETDMVTDLGGWC